MWEVSENVCVMMCVHVSCVSGNVEVRVFIEEGIETREHKYRYLYFKIAHFCSTDNTGYIHGVFVWVLLSRN